MTDAERYHNAAMKALAALQAITHYPRSLTVEDIKDHCQKMHDELEPIIMNRGQDGRPCPECKGWGSDEDWTCPACIGTGRVS